MYSGSHRDLAWVGGVEEKIRVLFARTVVAAKEDGSGALANRYLPSQNHTRGQVSGVIASINPIRNFDQNIESPTIH